MLINKMWSSEYVEVKQYVGMVFFSIPKKYEINFDDFKANYKVLIIWMVYFSFKRQM